MAGSRIYLNAASCVMGGGVQVAAGFIRHAAAVAGSRGWRVAVAASPAVADECTGLENEVADWWVADRRPASPIGGRPARAELARRVETFGADLVFTVFGPSYVRFRVPELTGFADGFVMNPLPGRFANHPTSAELRDRANGVVKRIALRSAQEYWVETETARAGLARAIRTDPALIHVVANGVNEAFADLAGDRAPADPPSLLVLGAAFWHKNHALLPRLAQVLEGSWPERPWRITVTIPEESPVWTALAAAAGAAGVEDRIVNVGRLSLRGCADAYATCTAVLHPSLLETFSATYVEAMAARRPLIVSDRSFAHEICGDAAVYFDPQDPRAAAAAVRTVLSDPDLRARLVAAGSDRLAHFPDARSKNDRLCDLIDDVRGSARS